MGGPIMSHLKTKYITLYCDTSTHDSQKAAECFDIILLDTTSL